MPTGERPAADVPLVSVLILNYNQREYLRRCLESVARQSYPRLETIVIDNASTDGSVEMVSTTFSHHRLLAFDQNFGYAGGHNRGFRESHGQYLLLLNADVELEPTFIEEMVRVMERADDVGMVQGRLYQMAEGEVGAGARRLDSVGLLVHRNRRTLLRGYGEVDRGQYEQVEEVFAPDGAAPLYRRRMLEDITLNGCPLDEAFFMYREEVDLGWRARWRGWRALYAPRAIAHHVRRYRPGGRRHQPRWLRRLQLRNRYCLLIKNDPWSNAVRDVLPIGWFELRMLAYGLFIEPHYLGAYLRAMQLAPAMWKQRRQILSQRRISLEAMRRWFV